MKLKATYLALCVVGAVVPQPTLCIGVSLGLPLLLYMRAAKRSGQPPV